MQIKTTILAILCAVSLAAPACGGDAKKADTKAVKTAKTDATPKTDAPKTDAPKVEDKTPEPPKDEPVKTDPNAEKVQTAATVAREISSDPEKADEILARHNLDRAKLDALMYEIGLDPQLTEAYMAARRNG
jgi:hypothetical protein